MPYAGLNIHFDHHAAHLQVEVLDANTGKSWHRAIDEMYLPRNNTSTGFYAFAFDGFTVGGKKVYEVPNGEYVLSVSVLKALGDESNPLHWESWTSPRFTVLRP